MRMHAARGIPTLGYLAQVLEPPQDLLRAQLARFHALCHIPMNTFSLSAACKLSEVGGPTLISIDALAKATAARAALSTLGTWQFWADEL